MKIILSESQIIQILKEAYGEEDYINSILDKMTREGMPSLSDKEREDLDKMSRGEKVDIERPNPEQETSGGYSDLMSSNHDMFMEMSPQSLQFVVDDERWIYMKEIEPGGEYEILLVTTEYHSKSFIITPFASENTFKVSTSIKDYNFKVKNNPQTEEQMARFIEEYVSSDLQKIVKYMKDKL